MDSSEKTTKGQHLEELARLRQRVAELEAMSADYKRTEEALQASETRYRRLFESARDGILILDAVTGQITNVNPFLIEMLGYSREELLGTGLWEIGPFKDTALTRAAFGELQSKGFARYEDLLLESKDGRLFDVEFVSNIYDVNDEKVIQCNIRDITKRRNAEEKLKYLSTHDELTGLHNRVFFDEEMSRLKRGRQFPISIIIADVDGLKRVNDTLGHAAGDELLKRAASVLKETFRAEEVVARIGGDEFVVLLPSTNSATAKAAMDRARKKLYAHNAAHAGPPLGFSLGAATAERSHSLLEALKHADEHMYGEKMVHKRHKIPPLWSLHTRKCGIGISGCRGASR